MSGTLFLVLLYAVANPCCLTGRGKSNKDVSKQNHASIVKQSVRLHDVFFFYFKKCIVPVRIKPDFQNMCKHVGLTKIILNKISQSLTNVVRQLNS